MLRSPSVFCFAKSTSLVRGRQRKAPNHYGLGLSYTLKLVFEGQDISETLLENAINSIQDSFVFHS